MVIADSHLKSFDFKTGLFCLKFQSESWPVFSDKRSPNNCISRNSMVPMILNPDCHSGKMMEPTLSLSILSESRCSTLSSICILDNLFQVTKFVLQCLRQSGYP